MGKEGLPGTLNISSALESKCSIKQEYSGQGRHLVQRAQADRHDESVKGGKERPAGKVVLSLIHRYPHTRGPRPEGEAWKVEWAGRGKVKYYLLVSFQLLHKGALVEEPLQSVLGVVVAQLLKRGSAG